MKKLRRHHTHVEGERIYLTNDQDCDGYAGMLNEGDVIEVKATKDRLVAAIYQQSVIEEGHAPGYKRHLKTLKKAQLEKIAENHNLLS